MGQFDIPDDLSIPEFLRRPKETPQQRGKRNAKYKGYQATIMPPDHHKVEYYDGHALPRGIDDSTRAFIAQLEATKKAKEKAAEAVKREEQIIKDKQKAAERAIKQKAREVARAAKEAAKAEARAAREATKAAKAAAKAKK